MVDGDRDLLQHSGGDVRLYRADSSVITANSPDPCRFPIISQSLSSAKDDCYSSGYQHIHARGRSLARVSFASDLHGDCNAEAETP